MALQISVIIKNSVPAILIVVGGYLFYLDAQFDSRRYGGIAILCLAIGVILFYLVQQSEEEFRSRHPYIWRDKR